MQSDNQNPMDSLAKDLTPEEREQLGLQEGQKAIVRNKKGASIEPRPADAQTNETNLEVPFALHIDIEQLIAVKGVRPVDAWVMRRRYSKTDLRTVAQWEEELRNYFNI